MEAKTWIIGSEFGSTMYYSQISVAQEYMLGAGHPGALKKDAHYLYKNVAIGQKSIK